MVEICTRHTYDEPEPPSRRRILPQDLEHVILSCPAKDPALRREHPPLVVCRVDLRRRLDDLGHSCRGTLLSAVATVLGSHLC
jgi:hypothetical protein